MISDKEALEAVNKIKQYCSGFNSWCDGCFFCGKDRPRKYCLLKDCSPCDWNVSNGKYKLSQAEYKLLKAFYLCGFYRVEKADNESYAYFTTVDGYDHCGAPTGLFKWIKKNESFKIADILSNYEIVEGAVGEE